MPSKKAELKKKTQDANFSLPIKNPNPPLKNGLRIRIPKLAKHWADSGSRIRIRIANPSNNNRYSITWMLHQIIKYSNKEILTDG